jgi:hypothetical protein
MAEFEQRLLDLLLRVHHERTIPRNGLMQRFSGDQRKANRDLTCGHLHRIAVTQHDERWRRNRWVVSPIAAPESRLAHQPFGEGPFVPLQALPAC